MACSGNANEPCGGPNRLNIFWSGATPLSPPSTNPGPPGWKFLACYAYVFDLAYAIPYLALVCDVKFKMPHLHLLVFLFCLEAAICKIR